MLKQITDLVKPVFIETFGGQIGRRDIVTLKFLNSEEFEDFFYKDGEMQELVRKSLETLKEQGKATGDFNFQSVWSFHDTSPFEKLKTPEGFFKHMNIIVSPVLNGTEDLRLEFVPEFGGGIKVGKKQRTFVAVFNSMDKTISKFELSKSRIVPGERRPQRY